MVVECSLGTHVSLGRGEAELNESDLGLLYTGNAGGHPLGQNQALHHLTIINGPSKNKHSRSHQSIKWQLNTKGAKKYFFSIYAFPFIYVPLCH